VEKDVEYLANKLNMERLSKLIKTIEQGDGDSSKKAFEEEVIVYLASSLFA
jgi:hypothetical protein